MKSTPLSREIAFYFMVTGTSIYGLLIVGLIYFTILTTHKIDDLFLILGPIVILSLLISIPCIVIANQTMSFFNKKTLFVLSILPIGLYILGYFI